MNGRHHEWESAQESRPVSPAETEALDDGCQDAALSDADYYDSGSSEDRIVDAITSLQRRLRGMERSLDLADHEIFRLKDEVVLWRALCREIPAKGIASLRRRVAFCCHADRGGDSSLLARFNAFFDFIEQLEQTCEASGFCARQRGGN